MPLNPTNSWTITFIRQWWPYMSLASVLRFRDYQLRWGRGEGDEARTVLLQLKHPVRTPIRLREVQSDQSVFHDVFVEENYKMVVDRLPECRTILDLGANIGLASLYFAMRYPRCQIFSVEPNPQNFRLLKENLKDLIQVGRCKEPLQAAVWHGSARLVPDQVRECDKYIGFHVRVAAGDEDASATVPGVGIEQIIADSGFEHIDLVKADIEGAEAALFQGSRDWLERVGAIAIEFHGDSRVSSDFDRVTSAAGFKILAEDPHTVLAVKERRPA